TPEVCPYHLNNGLGCGNCARAFSGLASVQHSPLRAIAGDTDFGRAISAETTADLRRCGVVMLPADLGIDPHTATRDLLAAQSIGDLVRCSGGLYEPPARFR
ncbi:MAG: malonate decarboxylase alpha subunit, partial [Acetobacteraceae bacterium]|nr:malonate decarboxylase alpha subunit [Acetobacteraceae bacterium]